MGDTITQRDAAEDVAGPVGVHDVAEQRAAEGERPEHLGTIRQTLSILYRVPLPTLSVDLSEILVFTRVVQGGSFTAASSNLGMPKSTVSPLPTT